MKRLLCLLLTLLILSCQLAYCETEEPEVLSFEPSITNSFDLSASEWFEDSYMRALLTILLYAEFPFAEELNVNSVDILMDTSFVAKSTVLLNTAYTLPDDGKVLNIVYTPIKGEADCFVMDIGATGDTLDLIVETALEGSSEAVYKNDLETMFEVAYKLSDALA